MSITVVGPPSTATAQRRLDSVTSSSMIPPGLAGGRGGAQHPLAVRLHRLQLLAPVAPIVRAAVREVEHAVVAAGGEVVVLERLVGAQREALQELGGQVVPAKVARGAVAAVDPDAGAIGNQLRDVDHGVVAL